jgi:hypothetical protein
MDRLGLKHGIFPHSYPFLQSSQLLPQKDSILFDVPASPIIPENAPQGVAEVSINANTRRLLLLTQDRENFLALYEDHLNLAKRVEQESCRSRFRISLDERIAEVA